MKHIKEYKLFKTNESVIANTLGPVIILGLIYGYKYNKRYN